MDGLTEPDLIQPKGLCKVVGTASAPVMQVLVQLHFELELKRPGDFVDAGRLPPGSDTACHLDVT